MGQKKKILFVYTDMILGGSTTSLLSLMEEMDHDKYDIDLLLYKNEGPMLSFIPDSVNLLEPACVLDGKNTFIRRLYLLVCHGYLFKAIWNNIKYKRKLGLSIQILMDARASLFSRNSENEYDIAIGYLEGWPDKYVSLNKVSAKKKVGWIHLDYSKSYYIPELDEKTFRSFDAVISVSKECEKNNINCLGYRNSKYLPNILSAEVIRERSLDYDMDDDFYNEWRNETRIRIITVCRISNIHKGIDRAIQTAAHLKKQGIAFRWVIIGDGADKKADQELIDDLELQDSIILIGSRKNPLPYVALADLFVLPSRYEGKPMVITEALILNVPVLVTEYASAAEQIQNEIDGVIVPNEDDALYLPLQEMLSNPQKLRSLKNSVILNEYGNEADIAIYDQFFEELINE